MNFFRIFSTNGHFLTSKTCFSAVLFFQAQMSSKNSEKIQKYTGIPPYLWYLVFVVSDNTVSKNIAGLCIRGFKFVFTQCFRQIHGTVYFKCFVNKLFGYLNRFAKKTISKMYEIYKEERN